MVKFIGYAAVLIFAVPAAIGFWVLDGFIVKFVWNMLAVPMFKVQPITVAGALAIGLVLGSFRNRMRPNKKMTSDEGIQAITQWCLRTLVLLAATFIISKYLGV